MVDVILYLMDNGAEDGVFVVLNISEQNIAVRTERSNGVTIIWVRNSSNLSIINNCNTDMFSLFYCCYNMQCLWKNTVCVQPRESKKICLHHHLKTIDTIYRVHFV